MTWRRFTLSAVVHGLRTLTRDDAQRIYPLLICLPGHGKMPTYVLSYSDTSGKL